MKRRRSPQEKKRLSLLKDRRNNYGESDKGARFAIPMAKKGTNRWVRRAAVPRPDDDSGRAEADMDLRLRRRWKKAADMPLGDFIARQAKARVGRAFRKHGERPA